MKPFVEFCGACVAAATGTHPDASCHPFDDFPESDRLVNQERRDAQGMSWRALVIIAHELHAPTKIDRPQFNCTTGETGIHPLVAVHCQARRAPLSVAPDT
jgi:hypothetical protein